jgi:hypothetical protein
MNDCGEEGKYLLQRSINLGPNQRLARRLLGIPRAGEGGCKMRHLIFAVITLASVIAVATGAVRGF